MSKSSKLCGLIVFASAIGAVCFTGSAFAGRDESQLLLQDKLDKEAITRRLEHNSDNAKSHAVDHGPRATTTQWLIRHQPAAHSK